MRLSSVVAATAWLSISIYTAADSFRPLYRLPVKGLLSASDETVEDVSPVFLSNESIGLVIRTGQYGSGTSRLVVLRFSGGKLIPVATAAKVAEDDLGRALANENLLVRGRHMAYLYASDLKARQPLPVGRLIAPAALSNVIGEVVGNRWKAFLLTPDLRAAAEGVGEMYALSDEVVVVKRNGMLVTESLRRKALGAFPFTASGEIVEIVGKDRIFLNVPGSERIVDFTGNQIVRVYPPPGWSFHHAWDANGGRMLFDHFARVVPVDQQRNERMTKALTFGLGVANEEANTELIKVIDLESRKVCFQGGNEGSLYGTVGQSHADLSPSGRLMVVASLVEVALYKLPERCSESAAR